MNEHPGWERETEPGGRLGRSAHDGRDAIITRELPTGQTRRILRALRRELHAKQRLTRRRLRRELAAGRRRERERSSRPGSEHRRARVGRQRN